MDDVTNSWMDWRSSGEVPIGHAAAAAFRVAPWTRHPGDRVVRTKVCPGRSCNTQLPLDCFAANSNMPDGLDVYCLTCNSRRREARKARFDMPVIDKFELFRNRMMQDVTKPSTMDELHCRISASIADAELTAGRSFKLEPTELSRKLLMRQRFTCTLTNGPVTPECFLQHHSLRFNLIDVEVSGRIRTAVKVTCTNTSLR